MQETIKHTTTSRWWHLHFSFLWSFSCWISTARDECCKNRHPQGCSKCPAMAELILSQGYCTLLFAFKQVNPTAKYIILYCKMSKKWAFTKFPLCHLGSAVHHHVPPVEFWLRSLVVLTITRWVLFCNLSVPQTPIKYCCIYCIIYMCVCMSLSIRVSKWKIDDTPCGCALKCFNKVPL